MEVLKAIFAALVGLLVIFACIAWAIAAVVIHADDSGIWLGTRLALYNATELPEMEGKEQVGAVLDIDGKAWEKMFFDEKYAETAGAAFGVNLTDADPLEQEARRVPLEMFYKGRLALCMATPGS